MDGKKSAKTKRRSDHVLRDLSKVQKHVLDLETPVKDKKDNLCVKVLRRKLRKGRAGIDLTLGRQTVIRNLPQLQKLDNVPVSSEEMVRSFFEFIEPRFGHSISLWFCPYFCPFALLPLFLPFCPLALISHNVLPSNFALALAIYAAIQTTFMARVRAKFEGKRV